MPPPADMAPPFEYHPAPWRTAGAGHRLGRAAVVKLSSRINVQWRTSTPVEAAFVALSMYAPWEKRCFRHQLLLPRPYLVLTKPLRLDIQCQRAASVKIGWKYLDD